MNPALRFRSLRGALLGALLPLAACDPVTPPTDLVPMRVEPDAAPHTPLPPRTVHYICQDGTELAVEYSSEGARLHLNGEHHLLLPEIAASGALFVDSSLEWHTKGEVGLLTGADDSLECHAQ
ncbi:MliC family protein [Isoalcanivorax beigongshangi]|uniref:MliC family protein n=1 Tax=Isoalcanivorax beigongshangi TaxID=3238810 RepID=A0ABV4AJ32_9GAMM